MAWIYIQAKGWLAMWLVSYLKPEFQQLILDIPSETELRYGWYMVP
jgi:hypothetical protein